MLTLNQNVQVGSDVLHVQTEPYRTSGKVVSNILKNGIVIKRVEQSIPPDAEDREINELVKALHYSVIKAIQEQYREQKVEVEEERVEKATEKKEVQKFSLPPEMVEKLSDYASEYVGFIAPSLVSSIIEQSDSLEDFVEKFKKELEGASDVDEFLKKLFRKYLSAFDIKVEMLDVDFRSALNRELLEEIYFEEFGFLAPQIAEDVLSKLSGIKDLSEALEVLKSPCEEESTKKKIEENKRKLFRI